jgi:hypothetical protein
MVKSKNHILTGVGFFMLVVALILLSPQRSYAPPGSSPPLNVNVVNPETDPVPTTVENPDSKPVPTYDVDNPAFQPVQDIVECSFDNGNSLCSNQIGTPAGKQLVIEFLVATARLPNGQVPRGTLTVTNFGLTGLAGGNLDIEYPVLLELTGTFSGEDFYHASQPVKLYPFPTSDIRLEATRDSTIGLAIFSVRFSGYLVDQPE